MAEQDILKFCLQTLDTGILIANADDGAIIFENENGFRWFGAADDDEDSIWNRFKDANIDKAERKFEQHKPYTFESEVSDPPRAIVLAISMRLEDLDGQKVILVECRNISKQKEAEYMLDSYSKMSEKNARKLAREKERVEKLLLNVMPKSVYEEMRDFGVATPHRYDEVSVLMLDFVGFTEMAVSRDPSALVAELNDIFSSFDRVSEMFGCERIKTIGDAYIAVSGLPEPNPEHAGNIAKTALRMRRYLEKRNRTSPNQWRCRIGLCTGPLIGSLVGIQKYVYDIFGPAANLSARLEAICDPMQILVSEVMYEGIRDDFAFSEKGTFELKGFGEQKVYELKSEND